MNATMQDEIRVRQREPAVRDRALLDLCHNQRCYLRFEGCQDGHPDWPTVPCHPESLRDYGVEGQLGLEPTPESYVANLVEVFRLVRDLLADDGVLWLNLGDSYAGSGRGGHVSDTSTLQGSIEHEQECRKARGSQLAPGLHAAAAAAGAIGRAWVPPPAGLKQKDLVGIPWRVAFALQADGWHLRSDIIWSKPNPMPESVTDRPTKAHEYLFLLAKRERYYYDADAIREPHVSPAIPRNRHQNGGGSAESLSGDVRQKFGVMEYHEAGRNKRSVWTISPQPYSGAHFATFPEALVEPCILAGSRVGDVVLDPFMGSGTVGQVAQRLGRKWLGCELNQEYAALQDIRTAQHGLELA
jgi:hypothetical protein